MAILDLAQCLCSVKKWVDKWKRERNPQSLQKCTFLGRYIWYCLTQINTNIIFIQTSNTVFRYFNYSVGVTKFFTTPVILTAQHCFFLASFLTNAQNTCAQLGRTQTGFHIYSGSRRSSLPVSFIVRYGCPRFLFIYYLYGVCAQHD